MGIEITTPTGRVDEHLWRFVRGSITWAPTLRTEDAGEVLRGPYRAGTQGEIAFTPTQVRREVGIVLMQTSGGGSLRRGATGPLIHSLDLHLVVHVPETSHRLGEITGRLTRLLVEKDWILTGTPRLYAWVEDSVTITGQGTSNDFEHHRMTFDVRWHALS